MLRLIIGLLAVATLGVSIAPLPEGEQGCKGHTFDFSRIRRVTTAASEDFGGKKSYRVRLASATETGDHCRIRLTELANGVRIFGAETVAILADCSSTEAALIERIETKGLTGLSFRDATGKTFDAIHVERGYQPSYSVQEVKQFLEKEFPVQQNGMEEPQLYIFPAEAGDFLSYFTKLLIMAPGSFPQVVQVIVDAHALKVLTTCTISSAPDSRRKLRETRRDARDGRVLQSLCATCATIQDIDTYSSTITTQQINSLYLNDAGRLAMVTQATLTAGGTILTPYNVDAYYWLGTYHCFSDLNTCYMVELPTGCSDALSDVQYVGIETLKYAVNQLKILGGLSTSASNPQSVRAFVHYGSSYCNAFYYFNQIVFGDCDCSTWSPLVAMDVVSHELAHGFTEKSSDLFYSDQSGGLNEGYSDILGTVFEYYLNDSHDTPDVTIGEAMQGSRGILRYMANPPQDGVSIDQACDFYAGMNVHYSSGVLNKAFVTAANACDAETCSLSYSECILLMGNLFFYTNLNRLTSLSDYEDAARETCNAVSSFVSELTPTTSCTTTQIRNFAITGWSAVGVTVDSSTCAASSGCSSPTPAPTGCSDACFSNVASVPVRKEGPTKMMDLKHGDLVLTANGYNMVYAFAHQDDKTVTEFLQLYTQQEPHDPLELTRQHMLFVVGKSHAIPAHAISPGDVLRSTHWPDGIMVVKVNKIYRSGIYAPLTTDGTVVVDGVVASCYVALQNDAGEYVQLRGGLSTGFSQHFFVHLAMTPVRMACIGISDALCKLYDSNGLAYFAKIAFATANWADGLTMSLQAVLLPVYLLGIGSLYILEFSLGPRVSVLAVIALIGAALATCANGTRGRRKAGFPLETERN